jgi:hypothetical protein
MPQPADQSVEGTVESAPIRLDGYYASDFRCLLKVLLPLYVIQDYRIVPILPNHRRQYRAKVDLSADEWKSVLKLASAWEFPALRDAAIEQLSKVKELDLIEKLIIAVRFHIDAWVVDTLNALAKRDAPIGIADAERLLPVVGLEYVLKIGQVREDGTGVNASAVVPAHNYSCAYCSRSYACNYANTSIITNASGQSRSQRDYTPVIRSVFGIQS